MLTEATEAASRLHGRVLCDKHVVMNSANFEVVCIGFTNTLAVSRRVLEEELLRVSGHFEDHGE